ncbi:Uncharacterised protein [Mycobacteroides abscessus subsp. abscessus]|nr:Uncharacterised protein [Mycobacteroides abscessus subsp. abscessus]
MVFLVKVRCTHSRMDFEVSLPGGPNPSPPWLPRSPSMK